MKGAYRLKQSRRISLSMQKLHLAAQTNGRCISHSPNILRWIYTTRPSELGRQYEVLINYDFGKSPRVFVVSPNIFELTDQKIPHLFYNIKDHEFREVACLCLYMKKYGEWHAEKLISSIFLPWIDLWLFYFEHWLATGTWEGGGEHPE